MVAGVREVRVLKRWAVGVAAALAVGAAPAHADTEWTPARLVSATPGDQGRGESLAPVLSGDARYVAYTTTAANLIPADVPAELRPPVSDGVRAGLRTDLSTGRVDLIAPEPIEDLSISGDGRYVAFDTAAPLDPVNDTDVLRDVYVRDMHRQLGDPGAYTLASAPDGEARAVAKAAASAVQAPPSAALSADGRRVLFVVNGVSDLAGAETPAGQLALRDLDTRRTTLVTTSHDAGLPVASAAAHAFAGRPAAQISADGETVLFRAPGAVSNQLVAPLNGQAPFAANTVDLFARRVPRGEPPARILRVLGDVDPADPVCDGTAHPGPSEPPYTAPGPCESPLVATQAAVNGDADAPSAWLSGDGNTAAFTSDAYAFRAAQLLGNQYPASGFADLRTGVTRKAGLREYAVTLQAFSADGRWLVGGPARPDRPGPLSADSDRPGLCGTESCIEATDVAANTSRIAVLGYDGLALRRAAGPRPVDGELPIDVLQPTISADGSRIAFATDANTVFFGDTNGAADVFVVDRVERSLPPGQQLVPPPPTPFSTSPRYALAVRVSRRKNGTLRVFVTVPAAGRLSVRATTRPAKRSSKRRAKRRPKRLVAQVSGRQRGPGMAKLTLRARARYRSATRRRAGLDVTVDVRFTPSARGPALRQRVPAKFRYTKKKSRRRR